MGSRLLFASSTARTTTDPLWRTTSRVTFRPFSRISSVYTRNRDLHSSTSMRSLPRWGCSYWMLFLPCHSFSVPDNFKVPSGMQRSVSIIGLGNWGSSLAHALDAAGVQSAGGHPLQATLAAGHSGWARALPLTTLDRAQLKADVLWLCVPDAAIARVTGRLVKTGWRSVVSRDKSSSIPAARSVRRCCRRLLVRGLLLASVHPVMSFAYPHSGFAARGSLWRRGGCRQPPHSERDRAPRRWPPISVEAGSKALYHAVGVLSSPLLVSHLAAAHEAAALAGFNPRQARRLIEPIVRATLDNFFLRGRGKSFSGPIARGDVQTIRSASSGPEAPSYVGGRVSLVGPVCSRNITRFGQERAAQFAAAKMMRNYSRTA